MTDYKQLCAELVDAIDSGIPTDRMHSSPLVLRARAALAEPEPSMSELSPAAQAVLEAYSNHWTVDPYEVSPEALAAALRAAADQVVPKEWPTIEDYNEYEQGVAAAHIKYRNQILAIADELEGVKYGTYRCELEAQ